MTARALSTVLAGRPPVTRDILGRRVTIERLSRPTARGRGWRWEVWHRNVVSGAGPVVSGTRFTRWGAYRAIAAELGRAPSRGSVSSAAPPAARAPHPPTRVRGVPHQAGGATRVAGPPHQRPSAATANRAVAARAVQPSPSWGP